jgi:glutaredoxin-like YruB-family protein
VVKDTARQVFGSAFDGLLGHADDTAAQDADAADPGPLSIAADEDAAEAVAADDEDTGESGFYKIVEPNGTVRFVANLSQLPAERRSQAERLAMAPTKVPGAPRRAAPRREAGQVAATAQAPPAKPAPIRASGGHDVVIYTTSWCGWCKKTIEWLDSNGVDYVNKDVEADPEAAAEMRDHVGGDSGVPVVVIDGEVIRGFSAAKMESLLL